MYEIPVLFVFFNRKDVTLKAFERICQIKPAKLYLAQDGYRTNKGKQEADKILEIRECVLGMIDWKCEIKTLFRTQNVGCSAGVKTAIDWMFENEEYGIILEDDCVAESSFWTFMQQLLIRYKDDQRIGMIAGYNPLDNIYTDASYTFSKYKACWGWATWKRAWRNMDIDMKWRDSEDAKSVINNMGGHGKDKNYWKYRLKAIDNNYVSAWDWQWYFSLASQNQLTIFPLSNLICNIGFGEEATHTSGFAFSYSKASKDITFPLKHPEYILPNIAFDKRFYRYNNTTYNKIIQLIPFGLKTWLKKIIKH